MMFEVQLFLLKVCLFGAYFLLSGATVTLTTGDGKMSFQSGSTVQLLCTINPYNNEITWLIDNDAHAGCFQSTCEPYANKPHSFTYNFNESAGVFSLTVVKVNISHADLEFACDDGNERKTIMFNVTTDKEQNNNSASNNVTSTLSTKPAINISTSGTGTNPTAVPSSISSVSILLKNNEQNGSERSNGGNGDIGTIVGGSVGGVALIGAVSLIGVAGYIRYKKHSTVKLIDKNDTEIDVPEFSEYTTSPTQIHVCWTQTNANRYAHLKFKVICNKEEKATIPDYSYVIKDLIPNNSYEIEIIAVCRESQSRPLKMTVETEAVTVHEAYVRYKQEKSYVKCEIGWIVKGFEEPASFDESVAFVYKVICYSGDAVLHKSGNITNLSYTIEELHHECSYTVCVYAIYRSVRLEPPCKIELTTPYKPTDLEATLHSTLIDLKWKKPDYTDKQELEYEITCGEDGHYKTDKRSYTIPNLIPGIAYSIKVYTLYKDKGRISLPVEKTFTTPAVTVSQGDVYLKPAESCVKCNIKWIVRDFEKPKPFKETDKLFYKVICFLGNDSVHESKTITDSNYSIPGLQPESSYKICVYAVYHSVVLEPPCKMEITTPYKPTNLEATSHSTLINLKWKKPDYTGSQELEYEITCGEDSHYKTDETSYTILDLIPGKAYSIKVCTLYKELISLPLEEAVSTPAVTVSQEEVSFEPEECCVKCNIRWTVRDFEKPKSFKETDKFLYNVKCYLGTQIQHTAETITDLNYTIPGLNPKFSYQICVYAVYHSIELQPPCKIDIEAPCTYEPTKLEANAESTLIYLKWKKPVFIQNQKFNYEVICDGVFKGETNNTTFKIGDCSPGRKYEIKIFAIINGIKSIPLVKIVRTQPLKPNELPPLKDGQQKALYTNTSNSVQFVREKGFAKTQTQQCRQCTDQIFCSQHLV